MRRFGSHQALAGASEGGRTRPQCLPHLPKDSAGEVWRMSQSAKTTPTNLLQDLDIRRQRWLPALEGGLSAVR